MKNQNIEELNLGKIKWLNVINAKKQEIEYLRKNYLFDIGDLGESLSAIESFRSKMRQRKHYLFLILRFPYYNKEKKEVTSEEIDIFINKDTFITIHRNKLPHMIVFFNLVKKERDRLIKEKITVEALFTDFLTSMYNDCYHMMDHINENIDAMHEQMFSETHIENVKKVLRTRMNIINFRKITIHHKNILKKIMRLETEYFSGLKYTNQLFSLISFTKDIWENIDSLKESIEALNSTNESLISYKLNHIIKTLTIVSVILFTLTLIAAIFAVDLQGVPFKEVKFGFWIVAFIMFVALTVILAIFKKKKWF